MRRHPRDEGADTMHTLRGRLRDADGDAASFELSGQARVFEAWTDCANSSAPDQTSGQPLVLRDRLNMARIAPEMAHVSVLSRGDDGFRFRLAGSGLRQVFACDARNRRISEVEICIGDEAWADASNQALDDLTPIKGRTITDDGRIHFWLRLPLSSDGRRADMVLCHDRFLPHGADSDPEAAAKALDHAMRLDSAAA